MMSQVEDAVTISAAQVPLDDVPWWLALPEDPVGTRLEDLPPDPFAGHQRELTDADAPTEQPPGGALATLLESVDLTDIGDGELVDVIAAAGRLASWVSAVELAATAELTDRTRAWRGVGCPLPAAPGDRTAPRIEPERMAAAEVALAQDISEGFAQAKVELAAALRRLPATRIALAAGRIDLGKARAIVEAVAVLDDEAAAAVEARVIERAAEQTLAGLRRSLRRAVIAADPAAAEARRQERLRGREVTHYAGSDGMGGLVWNGPIEQVESFWVWLTAAALAARGPEDTRTLAQARSDVMADIAATGLDRSLTHTGADLPVQHGRRPHISVVVAASTLLGLDDEPAELEGAGPITAELARRIAADGTWRRLLTEPSGRMVELSTDAYEPSQELQDLVIARDRHCRWPGCRMPAGRCDLDHAIPHPVGPTSERNLHPLHRSHHLVRTHTDVTVAIEDDGTTVWTMPSGRTYRVPPTKVLEHPDPNPAVLRDAIASMLGGELDVDVPRPWDRDDRGGWLGPDGSLLPRTTRGSAEAGVDPLVEPDIGPPLEPDADPAERAGPRSGPPPPDDPLDDIPPF